MSSADKSGRGATSVGEDSTVRDEPTTRVPAEDVELNPASLHASTPPWQRATSQLRDEQPEESYPATSGQLDAEDYPEPEQHNGLPGGLGSPSEHAPTDYDEQPTMIQPIVGNPDDQLFAPGGGNEGASGGRTSVNLGSGQRATPKRTSAPSALRRPGRGPRRASLQVKRVDPWSVLKLALVLSVALFLVWLVAVGVLYGVLDGMGVWDNLNGTYSDLVSGSKVSSGSEPLISIGRVFAVAAVVGAINIILFTALATVSAFIYNVSADLAGGLEVTLAERE